MPEQHGGAVAHDTDLIWRGIVVGFTLGTVFWLALLLLFL
jgi:hypothetical protein